MAKGNAKSLVKKKVGRPTVMTAETIKKLESVFKLGVTDQVAINYAQIGERTYYDHIKGDENFRRKMESAKHFGRLAAGNVIMDSIVKDKDVDSAKWWLEKKYKNEFGGMPSTLIQQNIGKENIAEAEVVDDDLKRITGELP